MLHKFLRYGSRHSLWFPRGYKGKSWPQLNPIESSSHGAGRKRTWRIDEPGWLFRLRQRAFCYAGTSFCDGSVAAWHWGQDGSRTCSYCGSLHPDDMARLVRKCIDTNAEEVSIEPSDKSYKVYVSQRGVQNAGQGGIKFYMYHVSPELLMPSAQEEYKRAVKLSDAKHQKLHEARIAQWAKKKDADAITP